MKAKTRSEEVLTAAPPATPSVNMQERIRERAYELWQQRGETAADDLSDWYRAEAEIRAALGPS